MIRRRRVLAAKIELVRDKDGVLRPVDPTSPARRAHGDVQAGYEPDDAGNRLPVRRVLTPTEQLARAGGLGDDVELALTAAAWFEQAAHIAGLGLQQAGERPNASEYTRIRRALTRLYEAIGRDAFNALIDHCAHLAPVPPGRRPLLRAALYAAARWLRTGAH